VGSGLGNVVPQTLQLVRAVTEPLPVTAPLVDPLASLVA
jgi:hypothetical protein